MDNPPPSQAQTAAKLLQAGEEAEMLIYLLNQQTPTPNHWLLPDGSSVIRHPHIGCYEFVPATGPSALQHACQPVYLPYPNTGNLLWRLLKKAEAEVSPGADESDDPPLSETEALSVCPELMNHITDVLDKFEPDDYVQEWLDQEAAYMAEDIRIELSRDQWQAIITAIRERTGK